MSTMANAESMLELPVAQAAEALPARGSVGEPSAMSFEQTAVFVLGTLQRALADMLAAAPSEIRKAVDVGRVFGVNSPLGWQIYRIANAKNPLAAGTHVPARTSMKKLLTSAARRRVPSEIIERVSEAFDAFEHFVETSAGDREEVEAMLNAFLPEERYRQDLANREAAFKANSKVRGIANEVDITASFYFPSKDKTAVDRAVLDASLGGRRSRPDVPIILGSGDFRPNSERPLSLDGQPFDGALGSLLPQFSTTPLPGLKTQQIGGTTYYCIEGHDVGLRSAADIVSAEYHPKMLPKYRPKDSWGYCGPSCRGISPAKHFTLDAFVHRDVYPGVVPELRVYDTLARGEVVRFDDPDRRIDLLKTHDVIRPLPSKLAALGLPHAPRYVEMLEYVYKTLGLDPAEFRGYRLDVEYPIYGAQYRMGFLVPEPPQT